MDVLQNVEHDNVVEWTISTLVRDRCSPELEELYIRLNETLIKSNTKSHFDELDLLYSQLDSQSIDTLELVPAVDQVLRIAAERSLNICGVELDPNVPLEMLCEAADIILNFDPTDTPTVLVEMLDACEDADEAFCSLMEQLGSYEADEWALQLLEISPHFTRTVRKACRDMALVLDAAVIDGTNDQALLKRLSRLVRSNKESMGAQLGSENTGLGVSTESLYGIHVNRMLDQPVEKSVLDIFSLAVISNEAYSVAMESVSACIDDLFYDVDERRKAEQFRLKFAESFKPIFGDEHA